MEIDKYFENEELGIWKEPEKKTVNIKSEITVKKTIDLRNEVKQLNSAMGINSLEDMAKLQTEPLTRDIEKKYLIAKADYENIKNTIIMFRDMIENCDKSTFSKDVLLADINMFFDPYLKED